jgi:hypothetical protein
VRVCSCAAVAWRWRLRLRSDQLQLGYFRYTHAQRKHACAGCMVNDTIVSGVDQRWRRGAARLMRCRRRCAAALPLAMPNKRQLQLRAHSARGERHAAFHALSSALAHETERYRSSLAFRWGLARPSHAAATPPHSTSSHMLSLMSCCTCAHAVLLSVARSSLSSLPRHVARPHLRRCGALRIACGAPGRSRLSSPP